MLIYLLSVPNDSRPHFCNSWDKIFFLSKTVATLTNTDHQVIICKTNEKVVQIQESILHPNSMCDYSSVKFHFLFRTEKNCGCSFSRDSKTARQSKKKARASYKGLLKIFKIEISNFTFQNFSIVQQSLQLQTLVVMQQNPQLALLNQV